MFERYILGGNAHAVEGVSECTGAELCNFGIDRQLFIAALAGAGYDFTGETKHKGRLTSVSDLWWNHYSVNGDGDRYRCVQSEYTNDRNDGSGTFGRPIGGIFFFHHWGALRAFFLNIKSICQKCSIFDVVGRVPGSWVLSVFSAWKMEVQGFIFTGMLRRIVRDGIHS